MFTPAMFIRIEDENSTDNPTTATDTKKVAGDERDG
jgi:hypothetical protein